MRAYPDLPDGANIEAWLVTIAHRKAIDITRSNARRATPTAKVTDEPAAPATDGRDHELIRAVAALPPKQRQAVAYHYIAGLRYAEMERLVPQIERIERPHQPAEVRQLDMIVLAAEQQAAEIGFQLLDRPGERGLRDVGEVRRAMKIERLAGGEEIADLVHLHDAPPADAATTSAR
jgi:hypothetical protein